ncbi:MAG: hypothetical protein ACK5YA_00945 [bacterium]
MLTDTAGLSSVCKKDGIVNPTYNDYNNYISYIPDVFLNKGKVNTREVVKSIQSYDTGLSFVSPLVITAKTPDIFNDYYSYFLSDSRIISDIELRHGRSFACHWAFMNPQYNEDLISKQLKKLKDNNFSYWATKFKDFTFSTSVNKCATPSIVSLTSNSSIHENFKAITECYYSIFKRKAYLHLYTACGMDEMEFVEAESKVNDIISKYQTLQDDYDEGEDNVREKIECEG